VVNVRRPWPRPIEWDCPAPIEFVIADQSRMGQRINRFGWTQHKHWANDLERGPQMLNAGGILPRRVRPLEESDNVPAVTG